MRGAALIALFAAGVAFAALAQQAPTPTPGGVVPKGALKGGGGVAGGQGQGQGQGGGGAMPAVGPLCDDTRTAVSTDGLTFRVEGALALSSASVPDGVLSKNGLGFYYVNGGDRHGTFLARPHDGVWERGDAVLINGVFNENAVDPDVVVLPDGRVRLYYFEGNFRGGTLAPGAPSPFFAAISDDGVRFTVEGKVFETPGATDPSVVPLPGGGWLLAVARAMNQEMVIARSDNGLNFSTIATLANGGIPDLAVLDDGRVRLYFNGQGGMLSRISADGGRTWTDEPGTRLTYQGFAADPSVIRLADRSWRMFFNTQDQACTLAVAQERAAAQGIALPEGFGQGQGGGGPTPGTAVGPPPLGNAKGAGTVPQGVTPKAVTPKAITP